MEPTDLEVAESIDMQRILEHGLRVKMVECTQVTHSVDVVEDVAIVENLMRGDPLLGKY